LVIEEPRLFNGLFKLPNYSITKLPNSFRGVSSTVKLPVSKTGLGGSNPSAPARFWKDDGKGQSSMGVETKKMANSIAASGDNFGDRLKAWPDRIKSFYNDVRTEMRKVTAPSWKEVQATTAVVVITVFIFGVYFFIIDNVIQKGVTFLYSYFGH
jgi:preprotein translocase subunit SecE